MNQISKLAKPRLEAPALMKPKPKQAKGQSL